MNEIQEKDNVIIRITNTFHDKFIIIDNKILYHLGASFKDLGKKCFAINKIEEEKIIKDLKIIFKHFKRKILNLPFNIVFQNKF